MRGWRRVAMSIVAGMFVVGMLSGCESGAPVPNAATASQKVENAGKSVAQTLEELGRIITDPTLTPRQMADLLLQKGKEAYCAAENSVVANTLEVGIENLWNKLSSANPELGLPPLDLNSETCNK